MADQLVIPGVVDPFGRQVPEFAIGKRHTVFEWCLIYTDDHPAAASPKYNEPTTKGRDLRRTLLGATEHPFTKLHRERGPGIIPPRHPGAASRFTQAKSVDSDPTPNRETEALDRGLQQLRIKSSRRRKAIDRYAAKAHHASPPDPANPHAIRNDFYRSLVAEIEAGRITAVAHYLHDKPDQLDDTLYEVEIEPVLEHARGRGDGGEIVRSLLSWYVEDDATAKAPRMREQQQVINAIIALARELKGLKAKERMRRIEQHLKMDPGWCKPRTYHRAMKSPAAIAAFANACQLPTERLPPGA